MMKKVNPRRLRHGPESGALLNERSRDAAVVFKSVPCLLDHAPLGCVHRQPFDGPLSFFEGFFRLGCKEQVACDTGQGRDLVAAGFRTTGRHHCARVPCEQGGRIQHVVDSGNALLECREGGLLCHRFDLWISRCRRC